MLVKNPWCLRDFPQINDDVPRFAYERPKMVGDINTLSFAEKYHTQTIKAKNRARNQGYSLAHHEKHVRLEITLESFLNDAIRKNITIRSKETRPQERLGIEDVVFLCLIPAQHEQLKGR